MNQAPTSSCRNPMSCLKCKWLVSICLGLIVLILSEARPGSTQTDREHLQQIAPLANRPGRLDPELRNRFLTDYGAARTGEKRAVFRRYLSALGADGILDALEGRNAFCHSEAHDLGKEIFAQVRELGPAVQLCGNRCTSGCMHGIMMEVIVGGTGHENPGHHVTLAEVKPKMKAICEDRLVADAYEPGNCAHGVGHAILILSGYDLGEALKHCAAFESAPLTYYCATGVFMENAINPGARDRNTGSLHYPCDTYTQFPAACYKYGIAHILAKHKGAIASAAEECLGLEAPQRRGCFYGLGSAHTALLSKQPDRLAAICGFGDAQDQAMCINGAIEILSDYHREAALTACGTLAGDNAAVCWAASRNGRYGSGKTFTLYYRQ